jgi:GNAT superfamily N-acetyltransferase
MWTITFTIREVSIEDAAAASTLVTELGYPTQPAEMRERLVGLLADPSYSAFVAESDGAPLGLAGGRVGRYFEKDGMYAQLVILVVAADAPERGIGSALLSAVEAWATSQGAKEITVNSGNHRDQAHRFYERRGFRGTGVRFIKALVGPSG